MGNKASQCREHSDNEKRHVPSNEEVEEVKEILKEKDEFLIQKKITEKANNWKKEKLLCAITGCESTGKSSLINAIRSIDCTNEGAAPVGEKEGSKEPTPYSDLENENLVYYDLPTSCAKDRSKETYLKQIDFKKYDFFFIVTSTTFTENDVLLTKQIRDEGKRFYFIRTKIDVDICNKIPNNKQNEGAVLENVRENITNYLKGNGFEKENVYLISNYHTELYDFSKLIEDVINDFPIHKQEAMTLSIHGFSETLIQEKKKILKRYIYLFSTASAVGALVPVPGFSLAVDSSIIMGEIAHYRRQFGLKDKDLKECGLMDLLTKEAVLKSFAAYGASTITEEVCRIVLPILGSVVASVLSFCTSYTMLNDILDKMADAGTKLLKHQLEYKVKDIEE